MEFPWDRLQLRGSEGSDGFIQLPIDPDCGFLK